MRHGRLTTLIFLHRPSYGGWLDPKIPNTPGPDEGNEWAEFGGGTPGAESMAASTPGGDYSYHAPSYSATTPVFESMTPGYPHSVDNMSSPAEFGTPSLSHFGDPPSVSYEEGPNQDWQTPGIHVRGFSHSSHAGTQGVIVSVNSDSSCTVRQVNGSESRVPSGQLEPLVPLKNDPVKVISGMVLLKL